MSFAFDRPIGSHGDVTELDYIAALHQTDVPGGLRKDGSIKGEHHARSNLSRDGVNTIASVRNGFLCRFADRLCSTDCYRCRYQLVSFLTIR